jgi:hypothetical protein
MAAMIVIVYDIYTKVLSHTTCVQKATMYLEFV